jgi:ATP-dependent protease ClpP protease subunit
MTYRRRRRSGRRDSDREHPLFGDYTLEDVHQYRVDRHNFIIYVGGEASHDSIIRSDGALAEPGVDYVMADRFEISLMILSNIDSQRPVLVVMASCGGSWEEGMQMFSAILYCPNPVTVLAVKWARSATSIIPLAADRFVIRPPAKYMYHRGAYAISGLDHEVETEDSERREANELMFRIYTARLKEQGTHSSKSFEEIRVTLEQESRQRINVWFSADESVKWGFADAVYDGNLKTLRAVKRNLARRRMFREILRKKITVVVTVR